MDLRIATLIQMKTMICVCITHLLIILGCTIHILPGSLARTEQIFTPFCAPGSLPPYSTNTLHFWPELLWGKRCKMQEHVREPVQQR